MSEKFDIVVVGGGVCGSFSALTAAKLGAKVVVCEEHGKIGVPQHCAGLVSISGLKRVGLNLPKKIVENEIKGAVFYSPRGKEFAVGRASSVACVLNRQLLDKHLADLAERAGVQFLLRSRAESLIVDSNFVRGIIVRRKGARETLESSLVIDAEGCSSTLLKKAGLQTLDRSMVVHAIQAEVDRVKKVDMDKVDVYLGRKYAPDFFAWIIPKRDGSAKIGLATTIGDPREYLNRFMQSHPIASKKLANSKVTTLSLHPIPLGGAIPKTYWNGLLVVGDAASQVKPTTGGGIVFGLLCSEIAGKVAYDALKSNNFSARFLSQYQSRWRKLVGFDLAAMRQVRKMLNRLPDNKVDKIIGLCSKLGANRFLEEVGDLDFQGKSLIRAIQYPTVLLIVFYSIFSSFISPDSPRNAPAAANYI
ncbi:MAG: NAD(P)/FAD-dependent oxidoreductase [Candidatus Bathyarchaeota archaeon]|nr:MAG: NAD(P)/FAD-dependent oxidoreductase [Candidatus Bathyarchaeota archaeon]